MVGVLPYSSFVEHKAKQGGVQPTPLKNVGSTILVKEPQINSLKTIKPVLQQPIGYSFFLSFLLIICAYFY